MSIIQEALKKVQNHTSDNGRASMPVLAQKPILGRGEEKIETKPRVHRSNIFLFITFFILLAVTLKIFFGGLKSDDKPERKREPDLASHQDVSYKSVLGQDTKNAGQPLELSPNTQSAVATDKPQVPRFVLNGIMYLSGRPQAVINDSVVEEGDVVSGARVISVDKNRVLLNFNDIEIQLTLKK